MIRRRAAAFAGLALSASVLAACASSDPFGRDLVAQPVHVLFFEGDSIALGDAAMAVVQDAANIARRYPNQPVRVLGFADPEGTAAANRALSSARALAVAGEMERLGVSSARIRVLARGETAFADIATESRRVEIRIGPQ
jgi:outer membrane protein OmpA-like peptidoglycan-associated protein